MEALKISQLTGKIRDLFFPAFNIIEVTGKFWESFSPALWVVSRALDNALELFSPAVVVVWCTMVVKVADVFVHCGVCDYEMGFCVINNKVRYTVLN